MKRLTDALMRSWPMIWTRTPHGLWLVILTRTRSPGAGPVV